MPPTAASPDPFRSSPEDEDEPPSRLTEEEECLLLDASMDELMEPSPATITPDAQEQSNPKKLMVVSGEDWTYDMRDLRTSSCKFPALTESMHQSNVSILRMRAEDKIISKYGISITQHDLLKLTGPGSNIEKKNGFLNDQILNFYLEMIAERSTMSDQDLPSVSVLPTTTYPGLCKGGYETVKRWTKRINIFKKDIVFIPIHLPAHWLLLVLDHKRRLLHLCDSGQSFISSGTRMRILMQMSRYIRRDYMETNQKEYADLDSYDWSESSSVPQQRNGFDCGAFVCQTAEFWSRREILSFTQSDMPFLKQKMLREISTGTMLS
jgi:sentrin-specific protease 1